MPVTPLHTDSLTVTPHAATADSLAGTPLYGAAGSTAAEAAPWAGFTKLQAPDSLTAQLPPGWQEQLALQPPGLTAHPVPYALRTDDLVVGILLAGCFIMAFFTARSWPQLHLSIKNFLYRQAGSERTDGERTGTEAGGQAFIVALTCFAGGILCHDYLQTYRPERAANLPPHLLIAAITLLGLLVTAGKIAAYAAINSLFFPAAKRRKWREAYTTSLILLGLTVVPLTLPAVFLNTSHLQLLPAVPAAYATIKILLFVRCFRIFFRYPLGYVHIILYFCALEIAPILILWRTIF